MQNAHRKHKALAFFLLVMFLFSITPKIYFHDVLANHKDELVCKEQDKNSPCFHRQAFHCHFDDVVVSAPFVSSSPFYAITLPSLFAGYTSFFPVAQFPSPFQQVDGRGPPQVS